MNEACELLRALAVRTWWDIEEGERVRIGLGEESITDRLLLDLARGFPQTKVVKWNRFEEARRTGADWDWWFVQFSPRRAVGLRIQAKRVDYFNERVNGLRHKNRWGAQRKRLVESAAAEGLHPLYCFYLSSRSRRQEGTRCLSHGSGGAPPGWQRFARELYGCSILAPEVVKSSIKAGDRSLDFFWPQLLPWSCLVCCEAMGADLIDRVDEQARRLRAEAAKGDEGRPASLVTDEFPPEVLAVLEGEGVGLRVAPDVGATAVTVVSDQLDQREGLE